MKLFIIVLLPMCTFLSSAQAASELTLKNKKMFFCTATNSEKILRVQIAEDWVEDCSWQEDGVCYGHPVGVSFWTYSPSKYLDWVPLNKDEYQFLGAVPDTPDVDQFQLSDAKVIFTCLADEKRD